MIPVHWIVLAVIFAFAAGWLLRGDCDEQSKIATRLNPMFKRDFKSKQGD